jgi:hypothetical protein
MIIHTFATLVSSFVHLMKMCLRKMMAAVGRLFKSLDFPEHSEQPQRLRELS